MAAANIGNNTEKWFVFIFVVFELFAVFMVYHFLGFIC